MPFPLIPLAIAALTAGSTAAQIHGTRSANRTNRRSLEAGERSDVRADALERARFAEERAALAEQLAEAKAAREAQLAEVKAERETRLARDRERWQDYLRINEPTWRAGNEMLGSLYDLAGYRGQGPAYTAQPNMPPEGARSTPGTAFATGGSGLSDLMTGRTSASALAMPRTSQVRRQAAPAQLMAPRGPAPLDLSTLMMLANGGFGADTIGRAIGS